MKMYVCYILLSVLLLGTIDIRAALPVRTAAAFRNVVSDSLNTNATESEAKPATIKASHHLSFIQKVKLLRQMHKFRNQRAGDTHYGLASVCLAFAPVALFEIAYISGAFLTAGTGAIILILGLLFFLAAVIFGIKGLRSDKHNGLAILGLIFGILGISSYILGFIILSLLHAL